MLLEGGEGATVRERLLDTLRPSHHPAAADRELLRLGVKVNVLFFDKKPAREEPWTTDAWSYDLRTNRHFTLKRNEKTGPAYHRSSTPTEPTTGPSGLSPSDSSCSPTPS